jgi:hypothetical protein
VGLVAYAAFEANKANNAIGRYAEEIVAHGGGARSTVTALTSFDPAGALVRRAQDSATSGDAAAFGRSLEDLRTRLVAHHDALVWWVSGLLEDLATRRGANAVDAVTQVTDQVLWQPAFAGWEELPGPTRLHLTAETLRGHLGGIRRDGAFIVRDQDDQWFLILDPCGSCGVLRRGDPATGRAPDARGPGFYALHVALHRDTYGCDRRGPCTWTVPKEKES